MKKRLQADQIAKQDLDIKEKIRLMKEQINMYRGADQALREQDFS
jgi:hypothetical protein